MTEAAARPERIPLSSPARRTCPAALAIALVVLLPICGAPAHASSGGGIVGGILELMIEAGKQKARKEAYEAWVKQPPEIVACLSRAFRIDANQLVQQGIKPDDRRVQPYVEKCRQALAQVRAQAAEAERQRQQAIAQEEARLRAEAEQRAREAARRREAVRQARIDSLKSRFPDSWVPGIMAGEVELGWSREAVREALGRPRSRMRTPDGAELWTYPSQRVIFTDGKVSYAGK